MRDNADAPMFLAARKANQLLHRRCKCVMVSLVFLVTTGKIQE
jgi:hypothetical protein